MKLIQQSLMTHGTYYMTYTSNTDIFKRIAYFKYQGLFTTTEIALFKIHNELEYLIRDIDADINKIYELTEDEVFNSITLNTIISNL